MSRLRMHAGVRCADVEIDVLQIFLPRRDEHLTTALRVDEVHRGRCATRHPAVELTAFVIRATAAATIAGTSRRAGRRDGAVRAAASTTTTASAAAPTSEGCD